MKTKSPLTNLKSWKNLSSKDKEEIKKFEAFLHLISTPREFGTTVYDHWNNSYERIYGKKRRRRILRNSIW